MENENIAEKKTAEKSFERRALHFYRHVLMYVLIILVVLVLFCVQFYANFQEAIQDEYDKMKTTCSTAASSVERQRNLESMYLSTMSKSNKVWLRIAALDLADTEITSQVLDNITNNTRDSNTYYFITADKTCICPSGKSDCPLNEEQISSLLSLRALLIDETKYNAKKCGTGYLVAEYTQEIPSELENLLTIYVQASHAVIEEDGSIWVDHLTDVDKGFAVLEGVENVNQLYQFNPVVTVQQEKNVAELKWLSRYPSGIKKWTNLFVAVFCDVDGIGVYIYKPILCIAENTAMDVALPFSLILLFAFLSSFAARAYRAKWKGIKVVGKEIRIAKKIWLDITLTRNVVFVQCLVGAAVIFISLFIQMLSAFTNLYEQSANFISLTERSISGNQTCVDWLQQQFEEETESIAQICADYMNEHHDDGTDINYFLSNIQKATDAQEISAYDSNGVIVYSTTDYQGYKLSTQSDDAESRLWKLINGENTSLFYSLNDDGLYCGATRRVDDIGIIAIKLTDSKLMNLKEQLSEENVLINVQAGIGDKIYINASDPEIMNLIAAGSSEVEELKNTLTVLDYKDELFGIRRIRDISNFVYGKGEESASIYCAYDVKAIVDDILPAAWGVIIATILITILVMAGICIFATDDEETEGKKANAGKYQAEIADMQRKLFAFDSTAILTDVMLVLFVNSKVSSVPILTFLFFGSWKKNVSIFSIAAILIAFSLVYFVSKILRLFFQTLSAGLTSYSATICNLVGSTLNVGLFVWLGVYALNAIGVDTSTIIAGIGISGLAIGVGAKDTINDLLAGILIILDGYIRVGDTVEIEGFKGQVDYLGIRKTILRNDEAEISIRNSDMSNVKNLSKGSCQVSVFFTVSAGTDFDLLEGIIKENNFRIARACEGKLTGRLLFSRCDPPDDLKCSVNAPVEREYFEEIEDKFRDAFIKVMQDNDIDIKLVEAKQTDVKSVQS